MKIQGHGKMADFIFIYINPSILVNKEMTTAHLKQKYNYLQKTVLIKKQYLMYIKVTLI